MRIGDIVPGANDGVAAICGRHDGNVLSMLKQEEPGPTDLQLFSACSSLRPGAMAYPGFNCLVLIWTLLIASSLMPVLCLMM